MPESVEDYWIPEGFFDQRTVFLLGGGPSLAGFDVERLRGRTVFAINASLYLCPWAAALFFMDTHWFEANRAAVAAFTGVAITSSRDAKHLAPSLKRIGIAAGDEFTFGTPWLRFCRSSGHAAIALSIAMGATRIVLLGFDMRLIDGRSHFHDAYATRDGAMFGREFLPWFRGWNEAARRCGVAIVNCTPGSALTEFPAGDIDSELARLRPAHGRR